MRNFHNLSFLCHVLLTYAFHPLWDIRHQQLNAYMTTKGLGLVLLLGSGLGSTKVEVLQFLPIILCFNQNLVFL
jgi:hypothetical protein